MKVISSTVAALSIYQGQSACVKLVGDFATVPGLTNGPGFEDVVADGFVTCHVCEGSSITCETSVKQTGGLISTFQSSHIHKAGDGDGVAGVGPPVINFCGNNTNDGANNGTPYTAECKHITTDGARAVQTDIQGAFVQANNPEDETFASLLQQVTTDSTPFYYVYHTAESGAYWATTPTRSQGLVRAPLKIIPDDSCVQYKGELVTTPGLNNSEKFHDVTVTGTVECEICADLVMTCDTVINQTGGVLSNFQGAHIHVANDGDGHLGDGPPVLNFCGNGAINNGAPYLVDCVNVPSSGQAAVQDDVRGAFVAGTQDASETLTTLLAKMRNDPTPYYFNMHTVETLAYWATTDTPAQGLCRGTLHKVEDSGPTSTPSSPPTQAPTSDDSSACKYAAVLVLQLFVFALF
uniref:Uncharacterized protein n=1 Tax=Mucochytrium quahogii TaxID=96639 RepID=A0A7S2RE35_9STRA|mmetsp:Transcript_37591/g.61134  ORF Transcript_37591/g.61134 Transcript_37591/m.61134 type:complete len:408 (-) Transcript_37591:47-1270(-)